MQLISLVAVFSLALCACAQGPESPPDSHSVEVIPSTNAAAKREDREPEAATGLLHKPAVRHKHAMVAAANPHAARAGERILAKGGSAIDAAIAVQAMLTLVEPQSSGIGGGSFILYWDNQAKRLYSFDGRETAPMAATAELFFRDGKPMSWRDAIVGGNAVGVPGSLRALELAHQRHGQLAWQQLFDDSIALARQGFDVSPRLAKLIAMDIHPGLKLFERSRNYFRPGGKPLRAGQRRDNPALAQTLTAIARHGADYFYSGPMAQAIADTVQSAAVNPGRLRVADIAAYQALERAPLCGPYHQYRVCGMAPPSSGGTSVLQILSLLAPYKLADYPVNDLEALHLFTQASRLAYADRKAYGGDTDFTGLSMAPLLAPDYIDQRRKRISMAKDMGKAPPGTPYASVLTTPGETMAQPNTSHVVIVDAKGNALSMTSSIEMAFGSGLMVNGFLLNNQLTDFAFTPSKEGKPVLNRVQPGKRPMSAMAPTMVFNQQGSPVLVLGSPGGSRIIDYVAQTLIGVLDWQLNIQQAINLAKITNRNDYTALEKGTALAEQAAAFEGKGHKVKVIDLNSGLHGIQISPAGLIGGADPRREGIAVGF